MEQFTVALEICRISFLCLAVWVVSGLWMDVFLLRRVFPPSIRWPLIAIGGMTSHMILVLNLSYLGFSVRRGWYWAVAATLVPLLFQPKDVLGLLRSARSAWPVLLFVVLSVMTQSWSLVKEGVLTTSPAENGDWLTYVAQGDLLADYAYGNLQARLDYPQHALYTKYYEEANFRYGPSHLLASARVITGVSSVYIFTVFCGCLTGLLACALFVLATQLRLGDRTAFWLALLWSVHPSVHWLGLAAFMPQLVGVTIMLSLIAASPLLTGRHSRIVVGMVIGILLCGLFVGYNELLPLTGASIGLYLLAVARTRASRWRRIASGSLVMIGTACLLSPLGIYRGTLGMILQIEAARRSGGAEQAVDELVYFLGSWLGVLALPPTKTFVTQHIVDPWHAAAQWTAIGSLAVALFLIVAGLRRSNRGRRVVLPIAGAIGIGLAVYIQLTFDNSQFRTWGQYKLSQYLLPIAGLLMAAGTFRSTGKMRRVALPSSVFLAVVILAQGVHYYSGFPKTSLRINQPRYGMTVTTTDMDFVRAVRQIVPGDKPVLGVNDVALARNVTASLLLYPRRVLVPETSMSEVFSQGVSFTVEDRNYEKVLNLRGKVLWENERFSIRELRRDEMYLSLADATAKLLGPQSELAVPDCKPGDRVALHGFAPDGGRITTKSRAKGGLPPEAFQVKAGEFILQLPVQCEASGTYITIQTPARIFVVDYESVHNEERSQRLAKAVDELKAAPGLIMNLLPALMRSSAWQTRRFDGSTAAPSVGFDSSGAKIESPVATSGGLEAVVDLPAGWYQLAARATIPQELKGTGRGFGLGFLDLPSTQHWQKEAGDIEVRKLIYVPASGPRGFGIVLGGFGTVSGQVTVSQLELLPAPQFLSATQPVVVPLAPWNAPAWSPVSYDGAKDLSETALTESSLSLTSNRLTSSGLSTILDLKPGTYLLSARIEASTPATGPGLGYAVLLEGLPDSIISRKTAGTGSAERLFVIPAGGRYRLAALIGGYGMSQGTARFSRVELKRVIGTGSTIKSPASADVLLPSVASEQWRLVPLDPAPNQLAVRRGEGWVGLGSAGQSSSALVTAIRLEKGTYILAADIVAEESAVGSGRGYGVGLLQSQQLQWWVRDQGSHRIRAVFVVERPVADSLALIVGGYGTVKGAARFSQPVIRPLFFSSLAAVK